MPKTKKAMSGHFTEAGQILFRLRKGPEHEELIPTKNPTDRRHMQNAIHVSGRGLKAEGCKIETEAVGTQLRVRLTPPNGQPSTQIESPLKISVVREKTSVAETPAEQAARLKLSIELAEKLPFDKQKVLIKTLLRT